MTEHLHLAVALDGYGWHPEAWRHTPDLEPVTSGRYWSGLATTAERGQDQSVLIRDESHVGPGAQLHVVAK